MTDTVPRPVRCFGVRCLFGIWCLGFGICRASAADVIADVQADRTQVRLSESVRVTLSVEGEAPLRVEVPDEILNEESAPAWRARPDGPATVTDLPGNRQRWARAYRLDPYLPGKPLRLGFAPARAFAGTDPQPKEVAWGPVNITVTSEVTGASAVEARHPTGIEELPPVGDTADSLRERVTAFVALAVAVALAGVVGAWLLRKRRRPPPLSPEEWATARLDELATDDSAFADRLSDALRRYVEARTPMAATKLTTAELRAELERSAEWPTERTDGLIAVLNRCDRVKFAADRPTAEEAAGLVEAARHVVRPPAP
jgi:hypothetical protein